MLFLSYFVVDGSLLTDCSFIIYHFVTKSCDMSDKDFTDESEAEDSLKTTTKALPWESTSLDVINKKDKNEALSDEDNLSSYAASSNFIQQPYGSSSDKTLSWEPTSLDLANKHNIAPASKMENKKESIQVKTLPWEDEAANKQSKIPEINILLLGESGVGKSTFINSFANYMKHEHFEAVQQNSLRVLIPARFHIFDKEFKKHEIEIGAKDKNEYLADGAAATQDVKTYVFYINLENQPYKLRLIDTPGMGDPRGIDQDNKNCDYVLDYVGKLEKIHAICLLLKPTNTRLDVFLNYCVTQILSRLEKSATDNIAFLFTNTRGQNYTPGDTYTSLEVLVKTIKDTNNVTLPLSHKNVFCFDNEAFRFLASIKQGVEFKEGILEANIESWKYSYKEVYRLLSYIVKLNPHDPKKTISINRARKMVLQLSQPLAEIVQLIGDNIYQLDQHTHQLLMENQTMEDLKKKLHMPVIDIRVMELNRPVTVCTAPNCSTVYKVAEKNKYHYKQRCHNPCYLNNVPKEIVGDPAILECDAMGGTQTCRECNCRFNTHMHIYYETETFQNKIVDENVLKNITSKEDAAREKQNVINRILDHKDQLEKEHKYIIKCVATFAHFLQQNAITPINDALKEYVNYLIVREENLGAQSDRATLDYLKRLLSEYEQEKKILEEAMKHGTTSVIVDFTPNAIEEKIRELFTLRHFGKKIKQLYDLHQTGGLREHKESEYVVKEQYFLSGVVGAFKNFLGYGKSKKQHQLELQHERMLQASYYMSHGQEQQLRPRMPENLQFNGPYGEYHFFGPNIPRNHYNEWEQLKFGEPQYYDRGEPPTLRKPQRPSKELENNYDGNEVIFNGYYASRYNESRKVDFDKTREVFERSENREKRIAERRRQANNNFKAENSQALKHSKEALPKKNESQKSAQNNVSKRLAIAPAENTNTASNMEIDVQPLKGGKKGNKKKKNKKK